MIKPLSASRLLPAELADTIKSYLKAIADFGLENLFIARLTGLLHADLKGLNTALGVVRFNKWVDDVLEADAVRDDLFISFRDLVSSFKRRKKATLQEAYELIWPVIERAGTRLYLLGYVEQSGQMEAMFAELDREKYQTALKEMHALDLYEELKLSQSGFKTLYRNRVEADAESYLTLKEAKRPAVKHVNALLNALDILDETDPDDYKDLIGKIDAITSKMMTKVRARQTRKKNEGTDEDDLTTE